MGDGPVPRIMEELIQFVNKAGFLGPETYSLVRRRSLSFELSSVSSAAILLSSSARGLIGP